MLEQLPTNISLKILDVFGDIPNDLVEKYDVVHIRTFALVVTHSDPVPLLKNLVKMLSGSFHNSPLSESFPVGTLMLGARHRTRWLLAMGRIRYCDFHCPRPEQQHG